MCTKLFHGCSMSPVLASLLGAARPIFWIAFSPTLTDGGRGTEWSHPNEQRPDTRDKKQRHGARHAQAAPIDAPKCQIKSQARHRTGPNRH